MRIVVVHLLDVFDRLVGLRDDASGEQAAAGVAYAREHLPGVLDAVSQGFDRVVLAVEAGPSFRKHASLEPAWVETRAPRPKAFAAGYAREVAELRFRERCIVEAPPWPDGAPMLDLGGGDALPLAGTRGAGRDVVATIAAWWGHSPEDAGVLRIVSGRSSLLCLAGPGVELVRDVLPDGSWSPWTPEPGALDPRLVADVKALAMVGEWLKVRDGAKRSCLGEGTARRLVVQLGSVEAVMATVPAADQWPGLSAPAHAALVACSADGGRLWRRALAVHALRADVPLDVAAIVRGERGAENGVGAEVERRRLLGDGSPGRRGACVVPGTEEGDALPVPRAGEAHGEDVARAQAAASGQAAAEAAPLTLAEPAPAPPALAVREDAQARGESAAGPPAHVALPLPPRPSLSPARGRAGEGAADGRATHRDTKPDNTSPKRTQTMTQQTPEAVAEIVQPQPAAPTASLALTREARPLATPGDFGPEHMRIVREAFAPTASQAEFEVMWAGAKARRLDPVRKQIHFVKRKTKRDGQWVEQWTSIVSIDGFRAIAESTGKYDGQDEPEYEYDEESRLILARVRVWRKDISRPFVGVARWNEYVQTNQDGNPTATWAKMEHTMLSKCAESLAHRKAFPEPMAGLYTGEEMGQADNTRDVAERRHDVKPVSAQRSRLALRVEELAGREDIAGARAVLISEMQHHGIPERTQGLALADFDRRAGAPAASAT